MSTFKRILTSRTTLAAALVAGVAVVTALVTLAFTPQRSEGVAPPHVAEQRSVAGVCSLVITGYGGELWAAPLGGGQLKRVDRDQVGVTGCRVDPDPNRR
ncbi:hypothetical protein [[Mycobacterium] wendilense]|uniref:Uncharacterized protein n=1 Tax=[Mycobacterium] wendilense TaxID=3064284 RepID=A0ABN9P166_9MYCO|nr:hypothetical protein [Mycolicibacterium sp. MU0050]CAJ1579756.1 hypothetical protein MU0050_000672 [Mycolicibacterium sp. MU0050]